MPPLSEASSPPFAKANSSGSQISFHTSNFCPINYLKSTGPLRNWKRSGPYRFQRDHVSYWHSRLLVQPATSIHVVGQRHGWSCSRPLNGFADIGTALASKLWTVATNHTSGGRSQQRGSCAYVWDQTGPGSYRIMHQTWIDCVMFLQERYSWLHL